MRFTMFAILLSACATSTGGSPLPAELVGVWQVSEGNGALSYQFGAQGDVVFAGVLDNSSGCTYRVETSFQGVATLQGNLLALHPQTGTQSINTCGSITTTSYTDPETDAYQVSASQTGPVLYLQNQDTGVLLTLTHP